MRAHGWHKGSASPFGRSGFTLIELLVVIAIIAILAALLLPVLSRARAAADTVVCKNNLHQIDIGLQLYVEDYKAYPLFFIPSQYEPQLTWMDFIAPYTKVRAPHHVWSGLVATNWPNGLYDCPSFKRIPRHGATTSYAYNWTGIAEQGYQGSKLGLGGERVAPDNHDWYGVESWRNNLESEVVQPNDMIALGDGPLYPRWGVYFADSALNGPAREAGQQWPRGSSWPGLVLNKARHSGRFNVAFCDGHIEYLACQVLYSTNWAFDSLRRWNNDHEPHRELLPRTL